VGLGGALALLALLVVCSPASAALVKQSPAAIRHYWTPERMGAAIPPPEPSAESPSSSPLDLGGTGARRVVAPASAKRGGMHREVPNTRRYPNRTHGKVYFSSGALDYVCSGTVVRAPSKSLVWTAGHCVYDTETLGGYVENFVFVPGFRKGHRPFGKWPASSLRTTSQWKNSSGLLSDDGTPYDVGAATIAGRNGKKIQKVVGARGIEFNTSRHHHYAAFGYPAEPPFNGRKLYRCDSRYLGADRQMNHPRPMKILCDMTGGSSGGGWVVDGSYVASVVSYGYMGDDRHLYGPYLGNAAENLYDNVKSG
jgi:V8-like Glu-specific endopeptidase